MATTLWTVVLLSCGHLAVVFVGDALGCAKISTRRSRIARKRIPESTRRPPYLILDSLGLVKNSRRSLCELGPNRFPVTLLDWTIISVLVFQVHASLW